MQTSAFAHGTKKRLSGEVELGVQILALRRSVRSAVAPKFCWPAICRCDAPNRSLIGPRPPRWADGCQSARYLGSCSRPPVRLVIVPSVGSRVSSRPRWAVCWMAFKPNRLSGHHRREGKRCQQLILGRLPDALRGPGSYLWARLFAAASGRWVTWIGHVLAGRN